MADENENVDLAALIDSIMGDKMEDLLSSTVGDVLSGLLDEKLQSRQTVDNIAEELGESVGEKVEEALEEALEGLPAPPEGWGENDSGNDRTADSHDPWAGIPQEAFDALAESLDKLASPSLPPPAPNDSSANAPIPASSDPYQEENDAYADIIKQLDDLKAIPLGPFGMQDAADVGSTPQKRVGEEGWLNEDLALPVAVMGSIAEQQLELFMSLNSAIGDLVAAIDNLAENMVPREPQTAEELETLAQQKRDAEKERALDKKGSFADLLELGIGQGHKWGKKDATDAPKGIGQDIGRSMGSWQKTASMMGASDGLSKLIGVTGGLVTGFGIAKDKISGVVNSVNDFGESLLRSNFQFAEFSGAMQSAQAKMQVREMMFSQQRGDARADTADKFAEAWSEMKSSWAPVGDALANFMNTVGTVLAKILGTVGKIFSFLDRPTRSATSPITADMERSVATLMTDYGIDLRWGLAGR